MATSHARDSISELRHAIDQLELITWNIKASEAQRSTLDDPASAVQRTVEHKRLLGPIFFWLIFVVLSLVDWVANVPVFTQLLPRDPFSDVRFLEYTQHASKFGIWDGWHILWHRLMASPEVSILALGLVVILMFLCHACGASVRKLVAYLRKDEPKIEKEIRSQRRQALIPLIATTLALGGAIAFLLLARAQIEQVTSHQVDVAKVNYLHAQDELAKSSDEDMVRKAHEVQMAKQQLEAAETTHDYAAGIAGMNHALAILNLMLIAAAVIASYMHDEGNISEVASEAPQAALVEQKLEGLRHAALLARLQIRTLEVRALESIAHAKYLAGSSPLREWDAKASRLNAVVPMFRMENAKVRGIDVQLIKGFRKERPLDFTDPGQQPFPLPQELLEAEVQVLELRSVITRIQTKSIVGAGSEKRA